MILLGVFRTSAMSYAKNEGAVKSTAGKVFISTGLIYLYALTSIFLVVYIKNMNIIPLTALAEPNRLQIVELLRDKPRPVGEIVDRLRLNQPQVSKHLRVLADAGLVAVHPVAQQRVYELRPQPFKELNTWIDSYRHIWNERFDRLDEVLQVEKKKMHGRTK